MIFNYQIRIEALSFLIEHITDPTLHELLLGAKEAGPIIAPGGYVTGKYALTLTDAEREYLFDMLVALFCAIGLQPDNEPNEAGLKIEDIIDFICHKGMN